MNEIPDFLPGQLWLLTAPHGGKDVMLALASRLALGEDVFVLDAGNRFDAFRVTRAIRHRTVELYQTQARIQTARAFTCYEVLALLEKMQLAPAPILIIDMLATFYDETVTNAESYRLLRACIRHVDRLRGRAPVFISISPVEDPERPDLAELLKRTPKPPPMLFPEELMGKTTPTINDLILETERILAAFRRVLYAEERTAFDNLIVKARKHIAAISQANYMLPFEVAQFAMLFEQERDNMMRDEQMKALEYEIRQLKRQLRNID